MSLLALQMAMHDAVKDQRPVAEVAAELGMDAGRLAIYRRMVRGHVLTALTARMEVCTALLGAKTEGGAWPALLEAYLATHPPAHWSLGEAASAFPRFLERWMEAPDSGVLPFHIALAEFELGLFSVNHDQAQVPDPHEVYSAILNPTLQILEWPWPVATFVAAWGRGERPALPEPETEMVLVFRRPASGNPCYFVATPRLLFALKVVHDGLSVAEAVTLGGQPEAAVEAALAAAADIGLVIRPR